MQSIVINKSSLPEPILSFIQTDEVLVSAEDEKIVLSPIKNKPNVDELVGLFPKLSVEEFLKEKYDEEGDRW